MAGYSHPPGMGPRPPGVPPGYMLVDVPDREGLGGLGRGGTAACGLGVFLLGVGLGYFLSRRARLRRV